MRGGPKQPRAPVTPACSGLRLVPAPILPTNGGRTAPARWRRGQTVGWRPSHPNAVRPVGQLHRLGNRRIGGAEAFKTARDKLDPEQTAVLARRREPSMRETCLSTTTSAAQTPLVKIVYLHE